jgi:F0F1-type ATP synthase assembly protein I
MGFDFAAALLVFVLLGFWIDGHFGFSPWGVLIGAALGLIGGMYNLIRQGLEATRDAAEQDRGRDDDAASG